MGRVSSRIILSLIAQIVVLSSSGTQLPARLDSLEAAVSNSNSDSTKVRALISLSIGYQYLDHARARQTGTEALTIAEKNKWPWALYESYKQLAFLASLSGDYTTALKYDKANLELSIERNDSSAIAEVLNFIGNDYIQQGIYDEAYYSLIQCHTVSKAIDDSLRMDIALHNVGVVFKELGQYQIAMQHFQVARAIGERINDDDGLAYFYDERADVYLRIRDFKKAQETLFEARKLIKARKITIIEHRTLNKLAKLFLELGELDKSMAYYDSATALHLKSDNQFGLAETNLGKSRLLMAQKKYKEAEDLVNASLRAGRELNADKLASQSYQLLSELAERRGDFKGALDNFKNYKALQDSAFSQDMIQKLFQRQLGFVLERKDTEIALLSKERAAQDTAIKRKEFLSNILVVVVALTAIMLLTIYRSGQRRIRINKLLLEHQAEIKKRSVELEQLNQVKDKFFSIISHDLRSPMNALAGLLDLAEKKKLNQDEFASLSKELRTQFNHTKTLINNLLDWTLLQMDKLNIQADRIDLRQMVDDNIKLFGAMQLKDTTIGNLIPPGTFALADTNMINLVFRNLILNGIKFTESGGSIAVKARNDNGFIQVSIADNGVGIHPEVQKILFDKTSGYSTRGTANEKGTGLGLILCKEFVEKNGGKIWLESAVGTGTTFYFTLKRAN